MTALNTYVKTENGQYKIIDEKPYIGKMTGTMLGGIMSKSQWDTPFKVASKLLRLYDEHIDNSSVRAGKYLEPVILNYLDKSKRLENTQAEVLFPHYEEGSHLDWKSHFDDEYFSGHIDAVAGHVTDARMGIGIVENKTTVNPEAWDWVNSIPPTNYWLQASLYAYFLGYDTIYFTVGILTQDERDNPLKFVPNEDNVKIMQVGLYPDFESVLDRCREWYIAYIKQGVTPVPDLDNPIDRDVDSVLTAQISTMDDVLPYFKLYVEMSEKYNQMGKELDELKKHITVFLDSFNLNGIGNSALYYSYKSMSRKSVDTDRMKQDGIYEHYLKETSYKMFKKAKYE